MLGGDLRPVQKRGWRLLGAWAYQEVWGKLLCPGAAEECGNINASPPPSPLPKAFTKLANGPDANVCHFHHCVARSHTVGVRTGRPSLVGGTL